MMPRFYVTMTWDDWPEGGSYGTVIEAETSEQAETLCRQEMAATRAEDSDITAQDYLDDYSNEWVVVDCFDLDKFIEEHKR